LITIEEIINIIFKIFGLLEKTKVQGISRVKVATNLIFVGGKRTPLKLVDTTVVQVSGYGELDTDIRYDPGIDMISTPRGRRWTMKLLDEKFVVGRSSTTTPTIPFP